MDTLKEIIRNIPDFPEPGIQFKDITTLLKSPQHLKMAVEGLAAPFRPDAPDGPLADRIDAVAGMEARGFVFGSLVAWELDLPFIPIRKPGKLPASTHSIAYDLEYGSASLEIHQDALAPGQRVLVIDDLLATGGTAAATAELIGRCGAEIAAFAFLIELAFLTGRDMLAPHPVHAVIQY